MNTRKTEIIRLFHTHHVPFRMIRYAAPLFTIEAVATQRQVIREVLLKSILLREKKSARYVMACVLGNYRLDPYAVRQHLAPGWRRLSFASAAEVQQVTGYLCGAVAPLCLPAGMPILFDTAVIDYTRVNISCGDPLMGLELELRDLVRLVSPKFVPIVEAEARESQVPDPDVIPTQIDSPKQAAATGETK